MPISPAHAPVVAASTTPVSKSEKGDQLRTEELWAAAVVGKRHKRVQRIEITLNGAVIGFKTPEGCKNRTRHAISVFDLLEHIGIFDEVALAVLQARFGNQALGEFGEGQVEDRLFAVAVENFCSSIALCSSAMPFSPTPASRASLVRLSIH